MEQIIIKFKADKCKDCIEQTIYEVLDLIETAGYKPNASYTWGKTNIYLGENLGAEVVKDVRI